MGEHGRLAQRCVGIPLNKRDFGVDDLDAGMPALVDNRPGQVLQQVNTQRIAARFWHMERQNAVVEYEWQLRSSCGAAARGSHVPPRREPGCKIIGSPTVFWRGSCEHHELWHVTCVGRTWRKDAHANSGRRSPGGERQW